MDVFDVSIPAEVPLYKLFPYHEVILLFDDNTIAVVDTEAMFEERHISITHFRDEIGLDLDEFNSMYKHYYHTKMKIRLGEYYKKKIIRIYVGEK